MKTDTELRELDAWIAVNVFGATAALDRGFACRDGDDRHTVRFSKEAGWTVCPLYTTDPAAAMSVLEKCVEKENDGVVCGRLREKWCATRNGWGGGFHEAQTLPLAICLFARELFKEDAR